MEKLLLAVALGVCALAAAACGSSSGGAASGSVSSGTATMVSVKHVDGVGTVLVDSKGQALYSPMQEAGGKVLCTGSCTSIWQPLTTSGSAKPTGTSDVSAKLGTLDRPGGVVQVTYQGKPLYTFAEDSGPNTVTGNGAKDAFGGTSFTWHVAAPGAVTTTSTSGGGGYGY